jgi:hypothetical protein
MCESQKELRPAARILKINLLDHVTVGQAIAGWLGYLASMKPDFSDARTKKAKTADFYMPERLTLSYAPRRQSAGGAFQKRSRELAREQIIAKS